MASITVFHAGVIKYNGDHVLRAVLHVLCGLSCLKFLLLCDHAERATSAREAVIATQAASEAMGLEAVLAEWRTRAADRYGAIVSLQNAPGRRRALEVTDQELWVREVRLYRAGQRRHATPRAYLNDITAEDREPQITSILERTGGTLRGLYLPAHIDRNAVEAWIVWWRGLPVGISVQQAAAATRVDEPARRASIAENVVTAARIARVRGASGEGTFYGAISPAQACLDLAWTFRLFGSWMPHTWYHCRLCNESAIVRIQQASFIHLCFEEDACRDPEGARSAHRQLDWPWQVDCLDRFDLLTYQDVPEEDQELIISEDILFNEQGGRIFC